MLIIGFTEKYYTLWDVSTEDTYSTINDRHFKSGTITKNTYVQNLSFDLDKAKESASAKGCKTLLVDEDLKGHTRSFSKSVRYDEPEHGENEFQMGRYKYNDIRECTDLDYLIWYSNDQDCLVAMARVCGLDDTYMINEYNNLIIKPTKEEAAFNKMMKDAIRGHHGSDAEKVEIKIKEVDRFGFRGHYGWTDIVTYIDNNGRIFKYMGGSAKDLKADTEFTTIKATLKHSDYNGVNETKLQRIQIVSE